MKRFIVAGLIVLFFARCNRSPIQPFPAPDEAIKIAVDENGGDGILSDSTEIIIGKNVFTEPSEIIIERRETPINTPYIEGNYTTSAVRIVIDSKAFNENMNNVNLLSMKVYLPFSKSDTTINDIFEGYINGDTTFLIGTKVQKEGDRAYLYIAPHILKIYADMAGLDTIWVEITGVRKEGSKRKSFSSNLYRVEDGNFTLSSPITDAFDLQGKIPMILIHGFRPYQKLWQENFPEFLKAYWSDFGRYFFEDSLDENFALFAYAYDPDYLFTVAGSDLKDKINTAFPNDKVVIIAHSMGGLVARSFIISNGGGDKVIRLITLATPYHGSPLANLYTEGVVLAEGQGEEGLIALFANPSVEELYWDDIFLPGGNAVLTNDQIHKIFELVGNHFLYNLNTNDNYTSHYILYGGHTSFLGEESPYYKLGYSILKMSGFGANDGVVPDTSARYLNGTPFYKPPYFFEGFNHDSMHISSSLFAKIKDDLLEISGDIEIGSGKIIFVSGTSDTNTWEIYMSNCEGGARRQITQNNYGDYNPILTSDYSKIIFVSDEDGDEEIYRMNTDGTGREKLTDNTYKDCKPALSPDGSQIAFVSNRDGNDEIYLMNLSDLSVKRLTNNAAKDWSPTFSPDGSKIAFMSDRDGDWDIYTLNLSDLSIQQLTNDSVDEFSPAYSPDGTKIAFTYIGDGNREIYIMNADGTGWKNLTNNSAEDFDPSFSPDGSKIMFTTNRDGNYELYIMNVDGSGQTNITNSTEDEFDASWYYLNAKKR